MKNKIERRDFLKLTTATGTVLMFGNIVPQSVIAQEPVKTEEAEKVVITVITDNYTDALRPHDKIARRPEGTSSALDIILHAEHGLAYYIETVVNGLSHSFLFDFGTDYQGIKRNIGLLKIDLKNIEALVLSHDHFDHQAALIELLEDKRTDITPGLPFYVGKQFFSGSYFRRSGDYVTSLLALKREDIENLGLVKIIETSLPTQIVPGAYLIGQIDQFTDYEKIPPVFLTRRDGQLVQDDFIGEQAVVMNVRDKGLVVISGCAHRGIVNTVKHAQKITGINRVHAIIGGFHLTGARPDTIQRTIADIKAFYPDYIAPFHCTGFEAITAFAREMPEQFILNTSGTKYIMT
jgi:7,8-dihydropterin-6-yl-methyl-4-(beta-D-ribofuranosyl)aminobenzene 5'-phosphate synthase